MKLAKTSIIYYVLIAIMMFFAINMPLYGLDWNSAGEITKKVNIDRGIDPLQFHTITLNAISGATQGLKDYYQTDNINIVINNNRRSIKEQDQLYQNGRSKTRISLHNFDQAVDILISIDGVVQHADSPTSTIPYQIVGFYALQAGLFWGRDGDSGHIANTALVSQLVQQSNQYAFHPDMLEFYNILSQEVSVERKYQALIEQLEMIYSTSDYDWIYRDNDNSEEDTRELLPGINPYQN